MATTDPKQDPAARAVPPPVVMPPAPPGESHPAAVDRTRAISEALAQLGDNADAHKVADHVRATWGLTLSDEEVETIRRELRTHADPASQSPGGASGDRGGGP